MVDTPYKRGLARLTPSDVVATRKRATQMENNFNLLLSERRMESIASRRGVLACHRPQQQARSHAKRPTMLCRVCWTESSNTTAILWRYLEAFSGRVTKSATQM